MVPLYHTVVYINLHLSSYLGVRYYTTLVFGELWHMKKGISMMLTFCLEPVEMSMSTMANLVDRFVKFSHVSRLPQAIVFFFNFLFSKSVWSHNVKHLAHDPAPVQQRPSCFFCSLLFISLAVLTPPTIPLGQLPMHSLHNTTLICLRFLYFPTPLILLPDIWPLSLPISCVIVLSLIRS